MLCADVPVPGGASNWTVSHPSNSHTQEKTSNSTQFSICYSLQAQPSQEQTARMRRTLPVCLRLSARPTDAWFMQSLVENTPYLNGFGTTGYRYAHRAREFAGAGSHCLPSATAQPTQCLPPSRSPSSAVRASYEQLSTSVRSIGEGMGGRRTCYEGVVCVANDGISDAVRPGQEARPIAQRPLPART